MFVRSLLCVVLVSAVGASGAGETASEQTRLWVDADPEATQRIVDVLGTPLTSAGLDFQDTPLGEVVAFLSEEYGLEIALDHVGLHELGLAPDEPVTVSLSDVNLGVAIAEMLRPLELSYTVSGGLLTITSEEEATHNRLVTVVYPIRDMFGETPHYDDLMDVIVASIDCEIWAENGGGIAELRVAPFRGALVVTAPTRTQAKVLAFLRALRQSPLDPDAKPHWSNDPSALREQSCEFQDPENPPEPAPGQPDETGGGMF